MFNHPALLWFLPAALLPIVLHLITLYRVRTVELSTFRFLMDSYLKQRRRFKFWEWLIVMLRVLCVALIVMLIARPVLQRFGGLFAGDGRQVVIVVDAGASMSVTSSGRTGLDRAKDAAVGVIDLLADSDTVTLVRAGRQPTLLMQSPAEQAESLRNAILSIEPDATPSDLAAAFDVARDALADTPDTVYVATDANRRSWATLQSRTQDGTTAGPRTVVLDVGPDDAVQNVGLIGEPPRTLRPTVDLPIVLRATVVNGSAGDPVDTAISVIIDDQQVAQAPVTLAPNQRKTLTIPYTPRRAGLLRGRFVLPADAFPSDDQFLFSLNVERRLRTLIVTSRSGNGDNGDTPRVFDAARFITAALRSPLLAGDVRRKSNDGQAERSIAESLAIATVESHALTEDDLRQADTVVLADAPLDADRATMLRRYIENGGGVLALTGPSVTRDVYNDFLIGAAFTPTPDALPRLAQPVGQPDDEASAVAVARGDAEHDVLRAFDTAAGAAFGSARVYRRFHIDLPDASTLARSGDTLLAGATASPATVLLRTSDGKPILIDAPIGRGHLLLAGFGATPRWSNVSLRPQFVPLLLRSVAYLRRPSPASTEPAIRPGDPAIVRLNESWRDATVQATDPTGRATSINTARTAVGREGVLLDTDRSGHYRFVVHRPGASPDDADAEVELGFTVNMAGDGIDLATLDEQAVRAALPNREVVYIRGSATDPTIAAQLSHRHELWKWLIALAFFVIGLEFLLATVRGSEDDAATGPLDNEGDAQPPSRVRSLLTALGWGRFD